MDISIKNDEMYSVGGECSYYVKKNELYCVEVNQIQVVKGGIEILIGKGKLDVVVEQYVFVFGIKLWLVLGESVIEFNVNGKISLIGKEFNFFVEGDGYIIMGGKLYFNMLGVKSGIMVLGVGYKGDIDVVVQVKFMIKGD